MDLHLSISYGFVSSKIYDKHDGSDFDIVNFPVLDGDVSRRPSYGVYISQLIRFASILNRVIGIIKQQLRNAFSKFYRRHYDLISKSMSD